MRPCKAIFSSLLLLVCLIKSVDLHAQINEQTSTITSSVSQIFVENGKSTYTVDSRYFDRIVNQEAVGYSININLPGTGPVELKVHRVYVVSPSAEFIIAGDSITGQYPFANCIQLEGIVAGYDTSHVVLSIFRNYAFGLIDLNYTSQFANQHYELTPSGYSGFGKAHLHLSVVDNEGLYGSGCTNVAYSVPNTPQIKTKKGDIRNSITSSDRTPIELDVAVDTDYKFYTMCNSSTQYAADYAVAVLSASSSIFRRDMNIAFRLSYLRIWKVVPPATLPAFYPYQSREQTGSDGAYNERLLTDARTEWNKITTVRRAFTSIMSGANLSGVSYVGSLCPSTYNCSETGSNINQYYLSVHWASHEIGHMCGSLHSHDPNGYQPPIDSCTRQGYYMHGGTIMSYCSPAYNYFHPREQTKIRSYVESSGTCVRTNMNASQDVEIVSMMEPVPGATIYNGTTNNICSTAVGMIPKIIVKNRGYTPLTSAPTAHAEIRDASGALVYSQNAPVPLLGALESSVIVFPTPDCICTAPCAGKTVRFVPEDGPYIIYTSIQYAPDPILDNNTLASTFNAVDLSPNSLLTITYPNANGIVLPGGQAIEIVCNQSSNLHAQIDYSPDGGMHWQAVDSNTVIATSPIHWVVPAVNTSNGLLRIKTLDSPSSPYVTTIPFGVVVGQDVRITRILTPSFTTEVPIVDGPFEPAVEVYNGGVVPQTNLRVELSIHKVDATRGECEIYHEIKSIAYLSNGDINQVVFPQVNFALLSGGATQYILYAVVVSANDDVPENNTTQRVFRLGNNRVTLLVQEPSGVQKLQIGTDINILWRAPVQSVPNCPTQNFNVSIEYTTDGVNYSPIAQNIPTIGFIGNYVWHVPHIVTHGTVRFRVFASPGVPPPCFPVIGTSEYCDITEIQPPLHLGVTSAVVAGNICSRLSWEHPLNSSVSSYQIYRSQDGGAMQLLATVTNLQNTPPFTTYSYDDFTVQQCVHYDYYMVSEWLDNTNNIHHTSANTEVISNTPIGSITSFVLHPTVFDQWGEQIANRRSPWVEPKRYSVYGDGGGVDNVRSSKVQFIILATELAAGGFAAGNHITDIGFINMWRAYSKTLKNFEIRMKKTTANVVSTTFDNTNLVSVLAPDRYKPFEYTSDVKDNEKWNMHSIAPFEWDGNSNLLVDVSFCQDNDNSETGIILAQGGWTATQKLETNAQLCVFTRSDVADVRNALTGEISGNVLRGDPARSSREDFRLVIERPNMTVLYPNTSTTLLKGKRYTLGWNPGCDDMKKVDLKCTSLGITLVDITPNGVDNSGTLEWTVPPNMVTTTQGRIRVEAYGNSSFYDESDQDITIRDQISTILITSPTNASNWIYGSQHVVQWSTSGTDPVSYVRIEYSIDGSNWYMVAGPIANNGSYLWDLRNVPIGNGVCRVRVSDYTNSTILAVSELFSIRSIPVPTLVSCDQYSVPDYIRIIWIEPNNIDLSDNAGYYICRGSNATNAVPIASVNAGVTTYDDHDVLPCIRYYYCIRTRTYGGEMSNNSNVKDGIVISNNVTFAVLSPNGGEKWTAKSNHMIQWYTCGVNVAQVAIEYTADNGYSWVSISPQCQNTGSYAWQLPNIASKNVRVRIKAYPGSVPVDISDANFEIYIPKSPAIANGSFHMLCVNSATGSLSAWGLNNSGQIGDGTSGTNAYKVSPVILGGIGNVASVAANGYHSMALINDGTVYSWGQGNNGRLGHGNTVGYTSPKKIEYCITDGVNGQFDGVSQIECGGQFSVALRGGRVYCWGANAYGQCGNQGTVDVTIPTSVASMTDIVSITAGETICLALKADGTLWAWGTCRSWYNSSILGVGNGIQQSMKTPTFVCAGVTAVKSRGDHVMCLKNDGTVWNWGDNYYAQTAQPQPPFEYITPQKVIGLSNVYRIFCGDFTEYVQKYDGTLWGWGKGNNGELGNGVYGCAVSPTQITTNIENIEYISGGSSHAAMSRIDGKIGTTGYNYYGVLGDPNVQLTQQRNVFDLLPQSFGKTAVHDEEQEPVVYEREYPLPAGELDSMQLKYRLVREASKLSNKSSSTPTSIKIYPDPAFDMATVECESSRIESIRIMNTLGSVMRLAVTPTPLATNRVQMDIKAFPSGGYYVEVLLQDGSSAKSILYVIH